MSDSSQSNEVEINVVSLFSSAASSSASNTVQQPTLRPNRTTTYVSPFDSSTSTGYEYQDPSKYLTPQGHKLPHAYKFWFHKRNYSSNIVSHDDYLQSFVQIGPFDTVEQFWSIYSRLRHPNDAQEYIYHCFRADLEPTWECEGNENGGKWQIHKLRHNRGVCYFEMALLSMIGDEFNLGDDLCGIVLTIKKHEEVLSFWNRDGQDQAKIERMKLAILRMLGLPSNIPMKYRLHRLAIDKLTNTTITPSTTNSITAIDLGEDNDQNQSQQDQQDQQSQQSSQQPQRNSSSHQQSTSTSSSSSQKI